MFVFLYIFIYKEPFYSNFPEGVNEVPILPLPYSPHPPLPYSPSLLLHCLIFDIDTFCPCDLFSYYFVAKVTKRLLLVLPTGQLVLYRPQIMTQYTLISRAKVMDVSLESI